MHDVAAARSDACSAHAMRCGQKAPWWVPPVWVSTVAFFLICLARVTCSAAGPGQRPPTDILDELLDNIAGDIGQAYADDFRNLSLRLPYLGEQRYAGRNLAVMAKRFIYAVRRIPTHVHNSTRPVTPVPAPSGTSEPKASSPAKLLCAHFLVYHEQLLRQIDKNIAASKGWCNAWALVFYRGEETDIARYKASRTAIVHASLYRNKAYQNFVPKPAMYAELLPLLQASAAAGRSYANVWLLDADMSLVAFDFAAYFAALQCAEQKGQKVLISQPIVHGEGKIQAFPALNIDFWDLNEASCKGQEERGHCSFLHVRDGKGASERKLVASRYCYIEQQAPMFNGPFLIWFLEHVVQPLGPVYDSMMDTDWGLDDVWCNAAKEYSGKLQALEGASEAKLASAPAPAVQPRLTRFGPCEVIVAAPIRHLQVDLQNVTLPLKHTHSLVNLWRFHFTGFLVRHIVQRTFPQWYEFDFEFTRLRTETHVTYLQDNYDKVYEDCKMK